MLALLVAGCLLPRKHSALVASARPPTLVALLPVEAPNASADSHPNREKLLRLGNQVLDTLAKAKDGRLVGPSKVVSLLGSQGVPLGLGWNIEGKDIATNLQTRAEAREAAHRLGVRRLSAAHSLRRGTRSSVWMAVEQASTPLSALWQEWN